MKNDKLDGYMIVGIAKKMGYQSIKVPSSPLSGYYSIINQLNQRLQLQIGPSQIDMIARKLRLITSEHIQKNATFYEKRLLLMKEIFPEKDHLKSAADLAGAFAKYLESFPSPHTTAFELEALAYTLNIRMVTLIEEDKWSIFNKSAGAVTHVFIVYDADKNFYFMKDIQNPTALLTREEDNKHIHLECKEKTPFFQEGTFNLPIKETLTLAEPVAMTDFTPEHNSSAKKWGYMIAPVPRDGLSVYYAVIDQLNRILNLNITGLSLAYVQYVHNHQLKKIAEHLRKLVSDHIIQNSKYYIPDISEHVSMAPHLKKLTAFLFTKKLAEQKTSAPHHELELIVLANVLNIRMIILKEETYRILNNRSDTVRTIWIYQNQQNYGSLQPINDKLAQFSRQRRLQEIDKNPPLHSEEKFEPGTFSLPIQEILTFEEKNTNSSVDSTHHFFPNIQQDFPLFKEGMIRLFKDSPFHQSRVFKDIVEAQNKFQLVKIIETFLASRKLLFPEKTVLTTKLEMLLESHKPANPLTAALSHHLYTFAMQYPPSFPLPMTFPIPIQVTVASPAPSTPEKSRQQKRKTPHPRGTGEFKCNFSGCNKRFLKNFTLARHVKTHFNKEEFCCDVPGCVKKYPTNASLKNHKKIVHQNEKFCCNFLGCDKKFTQKISLRKHMMNVHKISDFLSTQTSSSSTVNYKELSPCLQPHPYELQISSITNMIQNMLALILLSTPPTPEQHELQISSLTEMLQHVFVLLPSSPKQRESLVSEVTETLQSMLSSILSMPPSDPEQRKSHIFSTTEVVRHLIYLSVVKNDSNLESKRSASLSDGGSIIEAPCGQ